LITKDISNISVLFDRLIKTVHGYVSSIKMTEFDPPDAYVANGNLNSIKEVNVKKF
jgi:hypothetical protein